MALQSQLFRADPKLEAAAVSDAAHILPGATGPHVGKIQQALIQLDGAAIAQDSIYGPATAAAVLAYKQKRNIVNRSYQTKADNIAGKMTIAALDREMLAKESVPAGPIRIRAVNPVPSGGPTAGALAQRTTLLLGFKIDVDIPVFPGGNLLKIRLAPRSTGVLEIVNGRSGRVKCNNVVPQHGECPEKTSWIFDPAEPSSILAIRLNPEPRGPMAATGGQRDGGTVRLTKDSQIVHVDTFRPGDAFIDAATATSANTLVLEVRAGRLGVVPGQPPTKTAPGSKFFSADGEPNVPGGISGGRPVNPKGFGRKINLGGERETPGFEDYTADLDFSGFNSAASGGKWVFRPWTDDPDPAAGVKDKEASDICMRGTPVTDKTIKAIRRIAASGCRLTFDGGEKFVLVLKREFPFPPLEESKRQLVIEFP